MDALWLGPSDLDSLASPSQTGDLPFQLCLHTAYLTLHLVGKLNGDKRPQHFFYGSTIYASLAQSMKQHFLFRPGCTITHVGHRAEGKDNDRLSAWGVLDPDQTFRKWAGPELVIELEIGCH